LFFSRASKYFGGRLRAAFLAPETIIENMKIAEALILRADLKKRGAQVKERLNNNALVQEGEEPAQDPEALLEEFEQIAAQMLDIVKRINKTNTETKFEPAKTLTDALAERDVLASRLKAYQGLMDAATVRHDRYSHSEIKSKPTINIADLQKQIDTVSKEYRELDTKIQALNWQADLVE
jgi:hypothetical protein